jgi:hypothetical protein
MRVRMTHGEIRFSRAPARRGWRGRHASCGAGWRPAPG